MAFPTKCSCDLIGSKHIVLTEYNSVVYTDHAPVYVCVFLSLGSIHYWSCAIQF